MNGPNQELMQQYGTGDVFQEKTAGSTPFAAKIFFAMATMQLAQKFHDDMVRQQEQAMAMNGAIQQLRQAQMAETSHALRPGGTGLPVPFIAGPEDYYASLPLGMTQGMVRTASIAKEIGTEMAKKATSLLNLSPVKKPGMFPSFKSPGVPKPAALSNAGPDATQVFKRTAGGSISPAGGPYRMSAKPVVAPSNPSGGVGGALRSVGRFGKRTALIGLGAAGLGLYAATKPVLGALSTAGQHGNETYGATASGAPALAYGVNRWGEPQAGTPFIT